VFSSVNYCNIVLAGQLASTVDTGACFSRGSMGAAHCSTSSYKTIRTPALWSYFGYLPRLQTLLYGSQDINWLHSPAYMYSVNLLTPVADAILNACR